jgi:hypothetical protein
MVTIKSVEQAVVDAIEGHNQTTIKSIRDSVQGIERNLAAISLAMVSDNKRSEPDQSP